MCPPDLIAADLDAFTVERSSDLHEHDQGIPREQVAEIVRRAWEDALGLPADAPDLFEGLKQSEDHGVLAAARIERMLSVISSKTGVTLPLTIVFQASTVTGLTECVYTRSWKPFSRPLLLRPGDHNYRPLFVFPGLGGLGLDVVELCRTIDCKGPVYLCHPAGLDGSRPLLNDLSAIVRDHIDNIRSVQPHGPYQFFGYSYGGLVAIEIARTLAPEGDYTDFLGMLEPGLAEADWPYSVWLEYMARRFGHHVSELRRLTFTQAIGYAAQRLTPLLGRTARLLGNTTWWSPLEQTGLSPFVQAIWDAELDSERDYRMKFFDGKVTVFASTDGPSALCDPEKLWPPFVREVEVDWIAGNHMTILRPPSVELLARGVAARLPDNIASATEASSVAHRAV